MEKRDERLQALGQEIQTLVEAYESNVEHRQRQRNTPGPSHDKLKNIEDRLSPAGKEWLAAKKAELQQFRIDTPHIPEKKRNKKPGKLRGDWV